MVNNHYANTLLKSSDKIYLGRTRSVRGQYGNTVTFHCKKLKKVVGQ